MRPEGRWARGFTEGDDEAYTLTRLRLGVGVEAGRWARFFVEGQDARALGLSHAGPNLLDHVDFYQGYTEFGSRDGMVRLRVGRQEMQYGQQRLISVNPWRNTGRSFDAARILVGTDRLGVDLFASAVVEKDQDGRDGWVDGEFLYGGYGRVGREGDGFRVEPYVLMRTRSVTATRLVAEDRISAGARVVHHFSSPFDVTAEAVRQFGHSGDASISAWMAYGTVGYEFDAVSWQPRVEGEYSVASGDTDPDDGRLQGFDTLYSTPHRFYGYADLVGGRNIKDAHAEVTFRPAHDLSVVLDMHRLWLATRMDGLYSTSLGVTVSPPPGGFDTSDVGAELDLTVTYRVLDWLSVGGGWSRFFLGQLLRTHTSLSSSSFTYGTVEASF